MEITPATIMSILSLLLAAALVPWGKVLLSRAFKSFDDKVSNVQNQITNQLNTLTKQIEDVIKKQQINNTSFHDLDTKVAKDHVKLTESERYVNVQIRQVQADLIRETQIITTQLEAIHKKIDHVDDKLDKLQKYRG